jgi:dipeptidyl aminopeptidase/acylaminoacyl peptidase
MSPARRPEVHRLGGDRQRARRRIWKADPLAGPLGVRLSQNIFTGMIAAPLLIAQGTPDEAVPCASQEEYVVARRAVGQQIDFRRYPGLGHMPLVQPNSRFITELLEWTTDRLADRRSVRS